MKELKKATRKTRLVWKKTEVMYTLGATAAMVALVVSVWYQI